MDQSVYLLLRLFGEFGAITPSEFVEQESLSGSTISDPSLTCCWRALYPLPPKPPVWENIARSVFFNFSVCHHHT